MAAPLALMVLALAAAEPAAEIQERARAILGEQYQTELPGELPSVQAPGEMGSGGFTLPAVPPPAAGTMQVARTLLLALAIVAALLVLFAVARAVRQRLSAPGIGAAPAAAPPEATREASLAEAEALARQGRYAEAVHALLAVGLVRLAASDPAARAPAATSREILQTARLDAPARDALTVLVEAVEVSRFAERPVGEPCYERCAEALGRISGAGEEGAA